MKQSNPIGQSIVVLVISVFAICGILSLISSSATSETPMDRHVEYILDKHNYHCQYEVGECPQFECSHNGETK